jgi:hypothetical protein
MTRRPRVVIHTDAAFVTSVLIDSPDVDVLEVAEYTSDRVFRYTRLVDPSVIDALIGTSPIGQADDSPEQRRAEVAANGGRPTLSIVRDES